MVLRFLFYRKDLKKKEDENMIIQTGVRTDIPAFYSEWLANRIKEGYVLVRNPYNPLQVTRYDLSPEVVDLITFCTPASLSVLLMNTKKSINFPIK